MLSCAVLAPGALAGPIKSVDVLTLAGQDRPGLGVVDAIQRAGVNDSGDWIVQGRWRPASQGGTVSGIFGPLGRANAPFGVVPGVGLRVSTSAFLADLLPDGRVISAAALQPTSATDPEEDLSFWLFDALTPIASTPNAVQDGTGAGVYTLIDQRASTDGMGTFLMATEIAPPGEPLGAGAIVRRQIDPGSGVPTDTVLVREGQSIAGLPFPVTEAFDGVGSEAAPALAPSGAWAVPIRYGDGGFERGLAVIRDGAVFASDEMDPIDLPDGRRIVGPAAGNVALGASGDLAWIALVEDADGGVEQTLMRESTPIIGAGMTLDVGGVSMPVREASPQNLYVTPSGDVIWSGGVSVEGMGGEINGIFLNDQLLVDPATILDGVAFDVLTLRDVSPSGEWIVFSTFSLGGDPRHLIRVQIPAPAGAIVLLGGLGRSRRRFRATR